MICFCNLATFGLASIKRALVQIGLVSQLPDPTSKVIQLDLLSPSLCRQPIAILAHRPSCVRDDPSFQSESLI